MTSQPPQRAENLAVPSPCSAGWAGGWPRAPEGPQHRGAALAGEQDCTSAGEELIPGDLRNICALAASKRNKAADYPGPGQRAAASPFMALGELSV